MDVRNVSRKVALTAIGLVWSTIAGAAPLTFFGEDLVPGGVVPPGGAAATARASFLAGLIGVGNEDFESIAAGTSLAGGITVSFPGSGGSITATLSAGGTNPGGVCDLASGTVGAIGCNGFGRFPTSGDQWLHSSSDVLTMTFSAPIAAFGFYGTDIGDFSGVISLTLSGGGTVTLAIPHTVGAPDGSLLFFGFIDSAATYTSISFSNTGAGSDVFGFDDMVIGDLEQVRGVPEPGTVALLGLGLVGIAAVRRKRA